MSKVSSDFGRAIAKILCDNNLTLRAASLRSSISAAYWKDMSDGRVPSEEVIDRVAAAFPDASVNELRLAAGYSIKPDAADAVTAVEFALRGQSDIPEEGKKQILRFVRDIEKKYGKRARTP